MRARDHGHALGLVEEVARDALLPAEELLEHLPAGLETLLLLDLRGRTGGDEERDERRGGQHARAGEDD